MKKVIVKLSGPTVISLVVKSQISIRSNIVSARGQKGRGSEGREIDSESTKDDYRQETEKGVDSVLECIRSWIRKEDWEIWDEREFLYAKDQPVHMFIKWK